MDFWEFINAYAQGYEEGYIQGQLDLVEEDILRVIGKENDE